MHPFLDNIDWKTFESPSSDRPFGLMVDGDGLIPDPVREKLFQIATSLIGPRPRMEPDDDKMIGVWTASYSGRTWSFASEGARAAFVMATKGDVNAI